MLPTEIPQCEARKFVPDGGHIWRNNTALSWHGHHPPFRRCGASTTLEGTETAAIVKVLKTLWRQHLHLANLPLAACTVDGLFSDDDPPLKLLTVAELASPPVVGEPVIAMPSDAAADAALPVSVKVVAAKAAPVPAAKAVPVLAAVPKKAVAKAVGKKAAKAKAAAAAAAKAVVEATPVTKAVAVTATPVLKAPPSVPSGPMALCYAGLKH